MTCYFGTKKVAEQFSTVPGDIWQRLEAFLVVSMGEVSLAMSEGRSRDAANHLTMHRLVPTAITGPT